MTVVSVWGEEKGIKDTKEPIVFRQMYMADNTWKDTTYLPHNYDYVQRFKIMGPTVLFLAWDVGASQPALFRGYWNDGVV